NGYTALQLGVGEAKPQRVSLPLQGHFDKVGVKPKRQLQEFRVSPDCLLPAGSTVSAQHFVPGQLVDVCGISKGKGFQGVMKRWNFRGGAATHGNSVSHRVPGSTGCRQDPGRVFKNKKMPGRMGSDRVTVQNLKVVKIDPVKNLLYLHGAVPGNSGGFVRVVDAVKGPFYPSPPPVPTYTDKLSTHQLLAPLPDKDVGDYKEPDDPY
ncbi:50S ribosomal protein L3, partial [archaeon]